MEVAAATSLRNVQKIEADGTEDLGGVKEKEKRQSYAE